jgi:hypothetical protein
VFFNFVFLSSSYRSEIESCNFDDLVIELDNFRRSNSTLVKCNDAVRRTVVVICGCLIGVNNSSDRLTIVDKLLIKYMKIFRKKLIQ